MTGLQLMLQEEQAMQEVLMFHLYFHTQFICFLDAAKTFVGVVVIFPTAMLWLVRSSLVAQTEMARFAGDLRIPVGSYTYMTPIPSACYNGLVQAA